MKRSRGEDSVHYREVVNMGVGSDRWGWGCVGPA
jgi:hypothetical protein